jgi:hypothetical protein
LDDYWQTYPTLFPISSKLIIRNFGTSSASVGVKSPSDWTMKVRDIADFGEYKLSLDSVEYKICD